jgi:hypothetical protein
MVIGAHSAKTIGFRAFGLLGDANSPDEGDRYIANVRRGAVSVASHRQSILTPCRGEALRKVSEKPRDEKVCPHARLKGDGTESALLLGKRGWGSGSLAQEIDPNMEPAVGNTGIMNGVDEKAARVFDSELVATSSAEEGGGRRE